MSCLNNFLKIRVFAMVNKHWLQCLMNVFKDFIFVKFIPNNFACFHDILKALSCTKI
jgi:hypothetical protein